MAGSDPDEAVGRWDIHELFCHYNALYFRDSLGACAVSWAQAPLPDCAISTCDYYPGGGCDILLSKSLGECQTSFDLKNALLHEMIHAYMCINDNKTNHSDHGAKFQNMMNIINFSSLADQHRPVGGYNITTFHEIKKKFHHFKCDNCGDLVKSTKTKGPSHNDCIESLATNDMCQNSMCHWHSHKRLCSGSYHKVQESPGCAEVKSSRAVEVHVEDETKEVTFGNLHTTHRSNKRRTNNKPHSKEDASAGFLYPIGEATSSSVLHCASKDYSHKKAKLLKDSEFDVQAAATVQETPKRPRTAALKNNQGCNGQKKRKTSKSNSGYSVIIEWLDFFCVEETDEDEEPLINKRTERRKRQKSLKNYQAWESNNSVEVVDPTSCQSNSIKDSSCSRVSEDDNNCSTTCTVLSVESIAASQVIDRPVAKCSMNSLEVAGKQCNHEDLSSASSPPDLPFRSEIVEISDS